MQLALSSEALPSLSVDDLRRGARRRDLAGVEVLVGNGEHPGMPSVGSTALSGSGDERPPVQWLLLSATASLTDLLYWSRQAHLIGAGLVLRETAVETPLCVPLALLHATDVASAHRAAAWARMHDAKTCWEVELANVEEGQIEDVLDATAPTLAHVRVRGAGPERASGAAGSAGMGTLLKALALRGYGGTVALAPSAAAAEPAWRDWLFDERGWGCNTAAKKAAAG